ncbi:arabinose efflux permease family protein [Thermanaerovibrio velox DSM 12556]|uniref:Arabinose efflux permease family protein n=1 Tax=Thermanaerovibrio velox DSM 12556 TaxID=926567 RepID=H0UQN2_9BACT|nr:MFS transporter [Thermanaerovibrio velox]EHM10796.1 arabinose efflux permease family protein [Thermanaerovibrio velox DSM 12556]
MKGLVRSLRHRNFRLFFTGQAISLTGFWMQKVGTGWLVYRLTSSPMALGTVDFAASIPMLFLTPFTGALLDRWDLKSVLFLCQALCALQALALGVLTLTGLISYWHVILLSLAMGVINSFEMPTRHSLVPYLLEDRSDLGNALALNSSLFNLARLVGPSVAGFAIAKMGEGFCFMANAASYLATLKAIRMMRLPHKTRPEGERSSPLQDISEGWRYGSSNRVIRAVLLAMTALSFFAFPYLVMLPAVAKDVLQGDSRTLGFLTSATGVGGITGSLFMASGAMGMDLTRLLPRATVAFGAALVVFGLSSSPLPSMLSVGAAGFFMVLCLIGANTLLQLTSEDSKRSRVMGLYILSVMGMGPFGSLIIGGISKALTVGTALSVGGAMTALCGLGLFRAFRPGKPQDL